MSEVGKMTATPNKLIPEVVPRNAHNMRNSDLSPNTLKVLQHLISKGYKAYAVGGCIRDKLMGYKPKDFDVVTNATPEQIKACFRNCRLIGRRFRLAHITFGREIIEVATFRGHHDSEDTSNEAENEATNNKAKASATSTKPKKIADGVLAKKNEAGQLLRDNIFGSIEEDAARRDFTFNAMYFDVSDESILDFAKGLDSISSRTIVMIGDSALRFREDPVRMIRAIRFSCKLNMRLPDNLSQSIQKHAYLLANIPPARLFEEVSKLLLSGSGEATFISLRKHNLLTQLFPLLAALLKDDTSKEYQFICKMLRNTDVRISNELRITPAFLYAAFLWYPMEERAQELMFESSVPMHDAINVASSEILFQQSRRVMIPKRFSMPVKEIWSLQLRLQRRQGRRCLQLLTHPKFRAAYDFLLLRSSVEGGPLLEIAQWWTSLQEVSDNQKDKMISELAYKTPKKRARRKPKK